MNSPARYPDLLRQQSLESLTLPSGREVKLPKATPLFHAWRGAMPRDTYGRKPLLDLNGEMVFAELAILRLFELTGWEGRWIDSYRGKYRIGYWAENVTKDLPGQYQDVLHSIRAKSGCRGGYFDVFCWRDGITVFGEAKWQTHDRIRPSQRRWLEAALDIGIPVESFLIVEWAVQE
jgi:hypothetical protein